MRHTERIIKYLDGKLSETELKKFNQDLQDIPELREELELHQTIDKVISHHDELSFRKKLREAEQNFRDSRKRTRFSSKSLFSHKGLRSSVLFSALGIGAVLFLVMFFRGNSNPEDLYQEYYRKFDQDLLIRSTDVSENDILSEGVRHYLTGDYEKAYILLSLFIEQEDSVLAARYYRGLCLMESEKYDRAAEDFLIVSTEDFNYYREHSEWYLALDYLKTGQYDEAKDYLNDLTEGNTVYKKRAKKILRQLD